MGLNSEILNLAEELIDRCVLYYDESELLEIAEEPDIVAIVATILQISEKRKMYKPKLGHPLENAREYIRAYIEDCYL